MSWEEFVSYMDCKCGKGKIKLISRMDDWNRTEHTEIILCEYCREKDIKEKEYENKRKIEFKEQEKKVLNYFYINYLEEWFNYFNDLKSKKAIWQVVKDAKIERCSLSTLYDHWRCFSYTKNDYLNKLVRIDTIPKIMTLLGIWDKELHDMIKEPLEYLNREERRILNQAHAQRK